MRLLQVLDIGSLGLEVKIAMIEDDGTIAFAVRTYLKNMILTPKPIMIWLVRKTLNLMILT